MNRREFLKSLLGGAACVAMPAAAFAALEANNKYPKYYPGRGALINPFYSAPYDFLQIKYDWLGAGRLVITRKQDNASAPLKPMSLRVEGNGYFQEAVNFAEVSLEFSNFDINNEKLVLTKEGLPSKTINLSHFIGNGYQPGKSLVFIVDLEEPKYSWIGEGKITFNGEEIPNNPAPSNTFGHPA